MNVNVDTDSKKLSAKQTARMLKTTSVANTSTAYDENH